MYKGDLRLQIPFFFHQNMSVLSYMKHLKTRKIQILTALYEKGHTRIQQASAKLQNVFVKELLWC